MTDTAKQIAALRTMSDLSRMVPELVKQLELCYEILTGDDLRSLFVLVANCGVRYTAQDIDEVHMKQLINDAKAHLEKLIQ